jgi:microsomal dipeptidase-like Zn-dependent dipeptidase
VSRVADHIEYIADIVGRKHVGIASDFDGMYSSVEGLEDATKYPNLVGSIVLLPLKSSTSEKGHTRDGDMKVDKANMKIGCGND